MTKRLHGLITFRDNFNSNGTFSHEYSPYIGEQKDGGSPHPVYFSYEKFELYSRAQWGLAENSQEVSKWLLQPFPQAEVNKGLLIQNPGWGEAISQLREVSSGKETSVGGVRTGVYDLAGRYLGETTQGLRNGLYIKDGRIVMIKH